MRVTGKNSGRYSGLRVIKEALTGHRGWKPAWRDPQPKKEYDIIIVGGGGHGLATAHYLACKFNITSVAVIEKGWIGGGNVGRNTTIIRSNYLLDGNEPFYEFSLKLWEGLERDVNYNAMVSQRGIFEFAHRRPARCLSPQGQCHDAERCGCGVAECRAGRAPNAPS